MNAIDFLVKEHNHVRKLFEEISDASHKTETKSKMCDGLFSELIRHEKMEQSVWYPFLKKNQKLDGIIGHLISEEKDASKIIAEFKKHPLDDKWNDKFEKLKSDVEHHASEEETKLFPVVKKNLDESELEAIGKEMLNFKQEYKE